VHSKPSTLKLAIYGAFYSVYLNSKEILIGYISPAVIAQLESKDFYLVQFGRSCGL
jgi:hypothetical protein